MISRATLLPAALLLAACGPKKLGATDATDYFPVAEGASWTYHGTFNRYSSEETRGSVRDSVDGDPVWLFIEEADDHRDATAVGTFTGMIGLGAYRVSADGVETADLTWRSDLGGLSGDSFQPMLALPPQVGASAIPRTPSPDRAGGWTVVAIESVEVPAGTFHDCARLDLGQQSEAWLCPGVGLVKWNFITGRVEELVSWSIPGGTSGP